MTWMGRQGPVLVAASPGLLIHRTGHIIPAALGCHGAAQDPVWGQT